MATIAYVTAGSPDTITGIMVGSMPGTTPTPDYYVDITSVFPPPVIGSTTTNSGASWTAPTLSSVPANLDLFLTNLFNDLVANETYIAISPALATTLQVNTQVQALSKQVDTFIRIVTNELGSQAGT